MQPPNLVRVFVNYVAGVKLYNQRRRFGSGLGLRNLEFLDAIEQPPRTSVRRRMVRALADAACSNYDRWYVVAHSLGSVVAFNGLMAPSYAWPGYFTQHQWNELRGRGFAGPAQPAWNPPSEKTSPYRPVWAEDNEVAYRTAIFQKFHGFLTYGCPLEKFATLWPARVEISTEQAFRPGTTWLNIYDPTDPVSGVLRSFDWWGSYDDRYCPQPETIGYASSRLLLLSHIAYMDWEKREHTLADGLAMWLISGSSTGISDTAGPRWFSPFRTPPRGGSTPRADSHRHRLRSTLAWIGWVVLFLSLLALGAAVFPYFLNFIANLARLWWR